MSDFARDALREAGIDPDAAPPEVGRFPKDFWDARPLFSHARQAALSRLVVSPEALLVTVLGHISTHIPPVVNLPGPPRLAPPNLLICIVGHPGKAKGAVLDAAGEILPLPSNVVRHNLATAQGLSKAFYHLIKEGDDKKGTWIRHTNPVVFRINEIGTLAGLIGSKSGAGDLLINELKQVFSGERLGYDYATDDKRYRVDALTYRTLGLFGVAPNKAAPLFTDAGGGTPDRLLFATAVAAEEASLDAPDDPGLFSWRAPRPEGLQLFSVDASVDRRINEALLRRGQTNQPTSDFEAHIDLQQKKLAASLSFVEGRYCISAEDDELAGIIIDAHREMRQYVIAHVDAESRQRYEAGTRMQIDRTTAIDEARELREQDKRQKRIAEGAYKLALKVRQDSMTRGQARTEMRSYREIFNDLLDHALERHWVTEVRTASHTGDDRRLLVPGAVAPK